MHALIAAPYEDEHLLLRADSPRAVKIPARRCMELRQAVTRAAITPAWLADTARTAWDLNLTGHRVSTVVRVRHPGRFRHSRGTWEINLGCDYDCEHCYLGEKRFEGLTRPRKKHLLRVMRDAGVAWLEITGGEPLVDPDFPSAYRYAHRLGMVVKLLSPAHGCGTSPP